MPYSFSGWPPPIESPRCISSNFPPFQVPSEVALQSPLPKSVWVPPCLSNRSRPIEFAGTRCILLNLRRCESAGVPPDPTSLDSRESGRPSQSPSAQLPSAQWSVLTTGHAGSIRPCWAPAALGHPCMREKVLRVGGSIRSRSLLHRQCGGSCPSYFLSTSQATHLTGHMDNR